MNLQLEHKTAFISGSSQGIGFAIAEALSKEGVDVIINSNRKDLVDAAVDRLAKLIPGSRPSGVVSDLSTAEGVAVAVKEVTSVDILVNNLGFYTAKVFEEIDDEEWAAMMNVNFMSGVRLSRAYLPEMKERGWGRIIFISSEAAIKVPYDMVHYGASKAAQMALARGIAETTTGTGVTVNSVLPGPTRSEGVEEFIKQTVVAQGVTANEVEKEFFQSVRPTSIIKRFIRPAEIGAFVAYLCSPLAGAINGAALRVDGGVVATMT
jgi:NAD(P)-dependent dehydrogenase (short-subunit alcohol dehydrogenase family)